MSAHASDVLVIQLHRSYGPGALSGVLERAGLAMHMVRLDRGDQVPTDLRHIEGFIVLSGPPGVLDLKHAQDLSRVRALLRIARGKHLPTLAIGLGAQLAALALEGRPATGETEASSGAEITTLELTEAGDRDPLLSRLRADPRVLRISTEGVESLPPGAELLARDTEGSIGAFRVEESLWALEFHPEADDALVRRAFRTSSRLPAPSDPSRKGWTALLEAFAQQVRAD